MMQGRLLLSVDEAAEVLAISRTRVYEMIATREIPSLAMGRSRRISVEALRRFVAEREASSDLSA